MWRVGNLCVSQHAKMFYFPPIWIVRFMSIKSFNVLKLFFMTVGSVMCPHINDFCVFSVLVRVYQFIFSNNYLGLWFSPFWYFKKFIIRFYSALIFVSFFFFFWKLLKIDAYYIIVSLFFVQPPLLAYSFQPVNYWCLVFRHT